MGAALCATAVLLPHVSSATGVAAVAATASATAAGLLVAFYRHRGGLRLAFFADLWGIVLIAVLCASTGGTDSPFGLIYFFALGHAAAFQPPGRLALVCAAALRGLPRAADLHGRLDDIWGGRVCRGCPRTSCVRE